MMIRVFLAASSILLVGSIGAFFLFVSVLSIATSVCFIAGLMLMFGLGFQMGPQGVLPQNVGMNGRPRLCGLLGETEMSPAPARV